MELLIGRRRTPGTRRIRSNSRKEQLALNITRDYYLLQKKQATASDPITYDLVPAQLARYMWAIFVAVQAGGEWTGLEISSGRGPDSGGDGVYGETPDFTS